MRARTHDALFFQGIVCDSALRRFEVSRETLDNLEELDTTAIQDRSISFATFETLAGNCTRMSIVMPPAVTHHMYKKITRFLRTGGNRMPTAIAVAPSSGLGFEMDQ